MDQDDYNTMNKDEMAKFFGEWLLFVPHKRVSAEECDDMFWEYKGERFTTADMYREFLKFWFSL